MTPQYEFDTTPFFAIVARDLMWRFGNRAILYADQAIEKMKRLDQEEGLFMWREIRTQMFEKNIAMEEAAGATIH